MIEIVFGDSTCGSLKMAQSYGRGKYQSGAIGVSLSHDDGRPVTEKEIEDARREYDEKNRLAWENATPLGGKAADVYEFNLNLSVGNIAEIKLGPERQGVLEQMHSSFPNENKHQVVQEMLNRAKNNLEIVCERVSAGEDLRIWYSNQPDELCGIYWFMAQLNQMKEQCGQIYMIKLPEWESDEKNHIIRRVSWGEVAPGEWGRYLPLQVRVSPTVCKSFAFHWRMLQNENAPLRAMLNGQLVSVSETIYDAYITREIAAEAEEFNEAKIIGRVLGKYQLGISDYWVALRIEEMIQEGKLEIVTEAPKNYPIYHRILKKSKV